MAEIRRALNSLQTSGPVGQANIDRTGVYKHQNLPLPPIPKKSDLIYQPPSVVSSNSCSTENKYETIGKSLEPYKIEDKNKPKRLPSSTGSSYSSASSRYVLNPSGTDVIFDACPLKGGDKSLPPPPLRNHF